MMFFLIPIIEDIVFIRSNAEIILKIKKNLLRNNFTDRKNFRVTNQCLGHIQLACLEPESISYHISSI